MIQKKNQAARIADIEVNDLLVENDSVRSTSPTSKATKPPVEVTAPTEKPLDSHHPQVIDQDVENFTTRLDTLICQFRNESLKEFLTVKRTILHEQILTIDTEKKRCNALVSTKQDEIQHLSESLSKLTKSFNQSEAQKEALSLIVGTLKAKSLSFHLLSRALSGWISYHRRTREKKRTNKLIEKQFRRSLINYVFIPWKANWKRFNLNKQQKRFNETLDQEKVQLAMHFNKEIEMLKTRLFEAEKKVQTEEEAKISIQENLKKAFMRGVCAMNFEAMNILNPGSEVPPSTGKIDFFEQVKESPKKIEEDVKEELVEISVNLPAESKELKWKAAPVFGRPQTAQVQSEGLFSNLPVVSGNGASEGKVIVVNGGKTEAKITGKVPIKGVVKKK